MPTSLLNRALLVLLPATISLAILASAIWGESGMLVRYRLQGQLTNATANLAAIERENQRLLRDLQLQSRDPLVMERVIAEELGWGRDGDTIYRFPKNE